MNLLTFHANKKQYLDTLHIQKRRRKEMHRRMHSYDFDILLRNKSPKSIKIFKKLVVIGTTEFWCSDFHINSI